ncbi:MAG TPA: thioredoxin domain-containing protein [Acidobacteriota bacterium]|nr:thioredoxin domain-containing protein [Acidobacteriota bacterium]
MVEYKHTNRLIHETSPYLLQHAHNPVDWHPWGEEALGLAKKEDAPILLSIGYSACHWCHVMEHESFENEEIAAIMNEHFVCIKVDREERPDLDSIYMTAVQMMTGSGGWPMTVFLTPDQIPFYCGTYFPPEDRYGVPGFRRVLLSVAQSYRERREDFLGSIHAFAADLRNSNTAPGTRGKLDTSILDTASSGLIRNFDARNGGFGSAPKFPPSMALTFLLRTFLRTGKQPPLEAVNLTLTKMAHGGMYDQLGGGFHRYSVDARWLVPHFEKMLYDNALLSRIYLDGYLLTRNELYRRIAEETLEYVVREMTSPEGGFYSSQDADSEGEEGKFFLWTALDIKSVLGEKDGELFCRYFGCSAGGNFEGKNILNVPDPIGVVAQRNDISEDRLREIVRHGRRLLLQAREERVKPGRDDKILAAWNGMMLRSFAEAANVLDCEEYRHVAIRNAEFLLSRLRSDGRLLRSYKDGQARFNAYLEDYACLIDGLISLYEATFDSIWIREAEQLAGRMIEKFGDSRGGGFYFTSADHESLIHRPKEFFDNATPSGNSVAALALLRLWKLTGEQEWMQPAVSILEIMAEPMARHPAALPHMLCALDFCLGRTMEIAVIGNPSDEETRKLLDEVFRAYEPNKVVACGTHDDVFLLRGKPQIGGRATAYVCENFACKLPVTTAEDLATGLKNRRSSAN